MRRIWSGLGLRYGGGGDPGGVKPIGGDSIALKIGVIEDTVFQWIRIVRAIARLGGPVGLGEIPAPVAFDAESFSPHHSALPVMP